MTQLLGSREGSVPSPDVLSPDVALVILEDLLHELRGRTVALHPNMDLESDLGLGSLERTELVGRLERRLECPQPEALLADSHTVATFLDALARNGGGSPSSPLRQLAATVPVSERSNGECDVPSTLRTLVDMAEYRARADGDREHLTLYDDGEIAAGLSFASLWRRSCRVAGALAAEGLLPGDRVSLMLPTGESFFVSFLGILCAGAVPVPFYPPVRLDRLHGYLERQARLLSKVEARVLITERRLLPVAYLLRDAVTQPMAVEEATALEEGDQLAPVRPAPEDLGLIQYTSGSTGNPRGVALRHEGLLSNMRAIGAALKFVPDDVAVSWLPLYHDMGLIGVWLSCLLHGLRVVVLTPQQFLARPERWLWAFHRYRGTVSPSPNFGYELCCRKVTDDALSGLDLSSWRSAMNGAEPVRPGTVERFVRRFEPYGFRRQAMMPVYGLAETAVALTFTPLDRGPRLDQVDREAFHERGFALPANGRGSLRFLSSGVPLDGHEVRVVEADVALDREPATVTERTEGRILFRGPSTLAGYFRDPEATAAIRCGDWVDTGDLGYLAEGELFVTGRLKDLVIKAGRNYHPQDIENVAQRVDGIRKGCVAAFGVEAETGGEAIVVAAETRQPPETHDALRRAVVEAVFEEIGTPADRVVLLAPRTLPKTSSGKLQRGQCRRLYLDGTLDNDRDRDWPRLLGRALATLFATLWRRLLDGVAAAGRKVYGLYALLSLLLVSSVGGFLGRLFWSDERSTRRSARRTLRFAFRCAGLSPRLTGAPLPDGRMIMVSNHASLLDSLVLLQAIERPLTLTAKVQTFSNPVIGHYMTMAKHIVVRRSTPALRLESYRRMVEAVEEGRLLHFFPEATYTPVTGVRPFRLGAFQLAAEHGLTIVPVAILGTRQVLGDGHLLPAPGRIEVRVLEPMAPPDPDDFSGIVALRDAARKALAEAVGEPRLEITGADLPPGSQRED